MGTFAAMAFLVLYVGVNQEFVLLFFFLMFILITGGTSGLGRLAAKKLIEQGHTVVITGRSQSTLGDARKWIVRDATHDQNLLELVLDLTELKTIKAAVERLASFNLKCLDVIIHNAGGLTCQFERVGDVEKTVFMNAIAPLYLNQLLLPFIEKSNSPAKKIVFVTSTLHDPTVVGGSRTEQSRIPQDVQIEDLQGTTANNWDYMRYYRISKLATLWNTYCLSRKYPQVPVIAFCPGFVPSTELNRHSGFMLKLIMKYVLPWMSFATSEQEATDDYVFYATSDNIQSGTYYRKRKPETSSKDSLDVSKQEAYWTFANNQLN